MPFFLLTKVLWYELVNVAADLVPMGFRGLFCAAELLLEIILFTKGVKRAWGLFCLMPLIEIS